MTKSCRRLFVVLFLSAVFSAMIFVSCRGGKHLGLKRYDLFTINLGALPNELDWFYRDGFQMAGIGDVQSFDGMVYVSGGLTGKILVFNSYGDLLTYIYNPSVNPKPVSLEEKSGNINIKSWSLRNPQLLAVTKKGFFVVDSVDDDRRVKDEESGFYRDQLVLLFKQNGDYRGHLGQEGFGGAPFPNVESLYAREDGSLVVTCRTLNAWISYWYDPDGHPLFTVKILNEQLPGAEDGVVSSYSVLPDPVKTSLYVRVDVYPDPSDSSRPEPRLYSFDVQTRTYSNPIVLSYIGVDDPSGNGSSFPAIPPNYIGTTTNGTHVMLTLTGPDSYRFTMVDPQGRIVESRRITVGKGTEYFRIFKMQNDGLLTGILFEKEKAQVSWWRADKLNNETQ